MGTREPLLIFVALSMLSLLAPRSAFAQAWLSDRGRTEGRGIRTGDFELHPGVGLEGGYDSNVFLEDTSGNQVDNITVQGVRLYTNETPDAAANFRLTPHLFISTLGQERMTEGGTTEYVPPKFTFRGGISGSLYYMAGIDPKYTPVRGEGQINLAENIMPQRPFSLGFTQEGSLRRVPLQSNPAYQWHGGFGVKTTFGPRGGLLRATLGYSIGTDIYSTYVRAASFTGPNGNNTYEISDNDNYTHRFSERVNWKFLPKTALFQDFELGLQNYPSSASATPFSDKFNNGQVSTRFGVNGAFTKELSTTLAAGYGGVFFGDSTRDNESVLVQSSLNWRPSERVFWNLAYGRTVQSSLLGNTKLINDINTTFRLNFGGVFLVGLSAALKFVDYGIDRQQEAVYGRHANLVQGVSGFGYAPDVSRSDVVLDTDLSGEYRLNHWFAITGQFGYLQNFTDYAFLLENINGLNGPEILVSPAAYQNFVAMLGVRAFL